jgi:hypothetical protein
MTQQQREKLVFLARKLKGLEYCVDDQSVADALVDVLQGIDELLKED